MSAFNHVAPIRLSSSGLGCLDVPAVDDGLFTFLVGDARSPCPAIVAQFLSPKVTKLLMCDPTLEEYHLSTPDDKRLFERLLSLAAGYEIMISSSNAMALLPFANELENEELAELLSVQSPKVFNLEFAVTQL
jgi:hypothetical protein